MKDALLLVFANKQDLSGGVYPFLMGPIVLTYTDMNQPCDQRKSRTACN
jgi:hypothetical protein